MTSPWAACRISSSRTGSTPRRFLDISHCVAAGRESPLLSEVFQPVERDPLPYRSYAIIAAAVASYFSWPMPSGAAAVNTCRMLTAQPLQLLHRGGQRRLAPPAHDDARLGQPRDLALLAARTPIARLQGRVGHCDAVRSGVRLGPVAAVPLARRPRVRRAVGPSWATWLGRARGRAGRPRRPPPGRPTPCGSSRLGGPKRSRSVAIVVFLLSLSSSVR